MENVTTGGKRIEQRWMRAKKNDKEITHDEREQKGKM